MVVRVQIAADGFVNRVDVEESSGVADLDQRAQRLVRTAGPFGPPPTPLLTPAGTTDLSFPIRLDR
ncbi:energy transducer TonB [Methylobacterium sp. M6A4_1b]